MENTKQFEEALNLERQGAYARALEIFRELSSVAEVDRGDMLFHCGWCLENDPDGDREEALRYYQLAAETAVNPVVRMNSHFRAGWLLLHDRDYAAAAAAFHQAITLHEHHPVHEGIYQDAVYWYALSLEMQGMYLAAIRWYEKAREISPRLNPESRYRQILCLNRVGAFEEALALCHTFDHDPPKGFDIDRYRELCHLVAQERQMLETSLADNYLLERNPNHDIRKPHTG